MADAIPRQEFSVDLNTLENGTVTLRMMDRINVDDVFLHLVRREIFKLQTGEEPGDDVPHIFKDFLLKERFVPGQN
jgi:hypothetical protein